MVGHGVGGFLALQYFAEYRKRAAERLRFFSPGFCVSDLKRQSTIHIPLTQYWQLSVAGVQVLLDCFASPLFPREV